MNLETVTFKVVGLTPLLQHNPEKLMVRGGGIKQKRIPTAEEEAEMGAYRLPSGQLYIKATAFRSAILSAAKGKKVGKFSAKSVLAGAILPLSEVAPLEDPRTGEPVTAYEISVMRAVVQRQGVMRARPLIREWACLVPFHLDTDVVPADPVLELLQEAGARVGVCDYRPETGGFYGRFAAELAE